MRHVIRIVFVLAFLVLNICLLMPLVNRGMSWSEASLGLIPAAAIAFICFLLLVAGVGVKDKSRSRAARWWGAALVWSLLVGGIVTFATTSSYDSNMRTASDERTSNSNRRSSYSLEEAYAKSDQIGMVYGWMTLGFSGFSLLGLIISLAIRKKSPVAPPAN